MKKILIWSHDKVITSIEVEDNDTDEYIDEMVCQAAMLAMSIEWSEADY